MTIRLQVNLCVKEIRRYREQKFNNFKACGCVGNAFKFGKNKVAKTGLTPSF
jgi:hypothetical protein